MRILNMYDAGWGIAAIAKELGRSATFVYTILKEHHVPRRPVGGGHAGHYRIPQAEIYEVMRLYHEEGLTIREVAKLTGRSTSTTYWRLRQAGAPARRRGSRRTPQELRENQAPRD